MDPPHRTIVRPMGARQCRRLVRRELPHAQVPLNGFNQTDGNGPTGTPVVDSRSRTLIGVTVYGGANLGGTVYEITP